MDMQKELRQQKILNLILARRIGTQEELTDYLERAGVAATQSSVSRDLEELGVVKHQGYYTQTQGSRRASARGLLSLDTAGEDTIFIAVEGRKAQRAVIKRIWELFG